jgi:hypothetical protein
MYLLLIMIKTLHVLGTLGFLTIFWALWPLIIVTIHYLKWGSKHVVLQRPYRLNLKYKEKVKEKINKMLEERIIETVV